MRVAAGKPSTTVVEERPFAADMEGFLNDSNPKPSGALGSSGSGSGSF
jgi:hypothetical protein